MCFGGISKWKSASNGDLVMSKNCDAFTLPLARRNSTFRPIEFVDRQGLDGCARDGNVPITVIELNRFAVGREV
jgi:hypothetical protein